eukprot:TRINITY_DN2915_c0_g1_i2.p1 TRINITY_DN2915_c0_g1~~TRINITY_DN2915_c0_g1_i2.p1  ORF type:complete len:567 (-),score=124.59 TRINITY_DN2915_c0_g1_i2:149-1849(-)
MSGTTPIPTPTHRSRSSRARQLETSIALREEEWASRRRQRTREREERDRLRANLPTTSRSRTSYSQPNLNSPSRTLSDSPSSYSPSPTSPPPSSSSSSFPLSSSPTSSSSPFSYSHRRTPGSSPSSASSPSISSSPMSSLRHEVLRATRVTHSSSPTSPSSSSSYLSHSPSSSPSPSPSLSGPTSSMSTRRPYSALLAQRERERQELRERRQLQREQRAREWEEGVESAFRERREARRVRREAAAKNLEEAHEAIRQARELRLHRSAASLSSSSSSPPNQGTSENPSSSPPSPDTSQGELSQLVRYMDLLKDDASRVDGLREAAHALRELTRRFPLRSMESVGANSVIEWKVAESRGGETKYCAILCMDTDDWVETVCGHVFDRESLMNWIESSESSQSCPLCREQFAVFDKAAQREVSSVLIIHYLNLLGKQYASLWTRERKEIIFRFWGDIPSDRLRTLGSQFVAASENPVDVAECLRELVLAPLEVYEKQVRQALYDIVLKDVKAHLQMRLPSKFQNQLTKAIKVDIAYSLTQLVPEFFIKWWSSVFLPCIYDAMGELFLKGL